jgi:hypothetical protein
MAVRKTALTDFDPLEPAWIDERPASKNQFAVNQNTQTVTPAIQNTASTDPDTMPVQQASSQEQSSSPQNIPAQQNTPSEQSTPAEKNTAKEVAATPTKLPPPTPKAASMFSLPGTGQYYFAVNVLDPAVTLSSSRFSIGQFNRTRYAGSTLKHQLQEINNENQIIIVGVFDSYEVAKTYESTILPLLKDIMKVPAQQYTTFVITKESLDKLQNRQLINSYIEFYRNSN